MERLKAFQKEWMLLGISSLLCLSLSIFRINYTHQPTFFFLNWNLFLAFVPYSLSSLLLIYRKQSSAFIWLVFGVWLLFFPNAPYILTDLFHLRRSLNMPLWDDLILILSYGWTGLLFGFLSLMHLEKLLALKLNRNWIPIVLAFLLFTTSFGVYLGRYLRFNSWDILSTPQTLFLEIVDRILRPMAHPRTWGLTFFMGVFLNMAYWTFSRLGSKSTL